MDPNPEKVITPMITGVLNMLSAAAQQPSVKRFVLTSSCTSAASQKQGVGQTIDTITWNDEASRDAWAPPPYGPERGFTVYAASKMEMEREAWKWHAEHKPHFVLNTGQTPGICFRVAAYASISSPVHELWQESRPGQPRAPIDIVHDSSPVRRKLRRHCECSPV
jgi:NAD(P)-dependent dehydrogenase (short-subunit alcohol dehydrogenase family)